MSELELNPDLTPKPVFWTSKQDYYFKDDQVLKIDLSPASSRLHSSRYPRPPRLRKLRHALPSAPTSSNCAGALLPGCTVESKRRRCRRRRDGVPMRRRGAEASALRGARRWRLPGTLRGSRRPRNRRRSCLPRCGRASSGSGSGRWCCARPGWRPGPIRRQRRRRRLPEVWALAAPAPSLWRAGCRVPGGASAAPSAARASAHLFSRNPGNLLRGLFQSGLWPLVVPRWSRVFPQCTRVAQLSSYAWGMQPPSPSGAASQCWSAP